jgi:inositol oxygenase
MTAVTLSVLHDEEKSMQLYEGSIDTSIKSREAFRNYENSRRQAGVEDFYRLQHANQTYDFVINMERKYFQFNHFEMGIWECLEYLDTFVDDSDPDTSHSQLQHALQTAEAARRKYPQFDWLHLTALIHDVGKILSIACHEPQWAVVGDTFPVGCAFSEQCVFSSTFANNPDTHNPLYQTKLGIYSEHCGLDRVKMSFGHDEYMFQVCVHNQTLLPTEALAMIRYHSFYPYHTHGAYEYLLSPHDLHMKPWILLFNEFDLYSKDQPTIDVETVKPYYQSLIKKYFPISKLKW